MERNPILVQSMKNLSSSWAFRISWFLVGLGLVFTMLKTTTPYMTVASVAYFTMLTGFFLRRNRRVHVACMLSAIFLDFVLVLVLELQRSAVDTALSFTLSFQQQMHILTSSVAMLLYIPVVIIGMARLRAKWKGEKSRRWHMRLGLAALAFRTAGFFLMFSLLEYFVNRNA